MSPSRPEWLPPLTEGESVEQRFTCTGAAVWSDPRERRVFLASYGVIVGGIWLSQGNAWRVSLIASLFFAISALPTLMALAWRSDLTLTNRRVILLRGFRFLRPRQWSIARSEVFYRYRSLYSRKTGYAVKTLWGLGRTLQGKLTEALPWQPEGQS